MTDGSIIIAMHEEIFYLARCQGEGVLCRLFSLLEDTRGCSALCLVCEKNKTRCAQYMAIQEHGSCKVAVCHQRRLSGTNFGAR